MAMKISFREVASMLALLTILVANVGAQAVKPEKKSLEIAIAAFAHTTMPLLIAQDAGYFAKYGLSVNISAVSAGVAVQELISGRIDIYQGCSAAMMATLAGADIIYVAAGIDKSSLMLLGPKASQASMLY